MFSVTVYAVGPPKEKPKFLFRYVFLSCILGLCVFIGILMHDENIYHPKSVSQLIPGIGDNSVAGIYTELMHTSVVALLGIFEPLRLGWPQD